LVGSLRYARRRSGLASGLALVALVFRCKITEGDLATTDEVCAFRWAAAAEVAELADEAYAVAALTRSTATARQLYATTTACTWSSHDRRPEPRIAGPLRQRATARSRVGTRPATR
jgi:hypothetical protein